MGKIVAEMKCPQCGRDTQYASGACEWCGAGLFQQRHEVHQAAQAVLPATPDRRLLYDARRDRYLSLGLHVGAIGSWIALFVGLGGRHRPMLFPAPALVALAACAISLHVAAGLYYGRYRRYCPCPSCGGVMTLQNKIAIRPWYLCGRYQSPIYNYVYLCPGCGHSLGITGS